MTEGTRDLAASVRQRLLNVSRVRGDDPNLTLTRYAVERLLYRLSVSAHAQQFVLKGAMLFAVWFDQPYRATRDLDLAGYGDGSSARVRAVFAEICRLSVPPDGLRFDADSVTVSEIREAQEYGGKRVALLCYLGTARIPLQVDIGTGDAITPAVEEIHYPVLLDFPAPHLRVYPKETVVAEKLEAMVVLGMQNSRMKDFFDVWIMARELDFAGWVLAAAINNTFVRRGTPIPDGIPLALSDEFAADKAKVSQWRAFSERAGLKRDPADLAMVIKELHGFLMPVLEFLRTKDEPAQFSQVWRTNGPWMSKTDSVESG